MTEITVNAARPGPAILSGAHLRRFVAAVVLGFGALFLLTRTTVPVGDSRAWMDLAASGDATAFHYGETSHFLQPPLVHGIVTMLAGFGVRVSVDALFLGVCLAGTLVAIVCLGLIAAEIDRTMTAAWLAAVLYGTSLHAMTQWNGELYGLALGFVTTGVYLALRGGLIGPSLLFGLSVCCHSDFAMAAPVFALASWIGTAGRGSAGQRAVRAALLLALAGTTTAVVIFAGSWHIGKWTDALSLEHWLRQSYPARQQDVAAHPEVSRALKGLITAFTVGGHYWRDILSGRGQFEQPGFMPAAAAALVIVAITVLCVVASYRRRSMFLFGLAWLLPFHVLVNWWFVPTVEKYHGGALPGFVLLVTGGLLVVLGRVPARLRAGTTIAYFVLCAGLNLAGAVLPMQSLGVRAHAAAAALTRLEQERSGTAVFVACDDHKALRESGVPFLRLRSIWNKPAPQIQDAIIQWIDARLAEGKDPYLVGRWCVPEEWKTPWAKDRFDLHFLKQAYDFQATSITDIPISESVPTNPFNWVRGDVVRLIPRADRRR